MTIMITTIADRPGYLCAARAEKIVQHGLFHKDGVWTTTNPTISHAFCRWRSDRFELPGAVVCLVIDKSELVEGRHFTLEGKGDIYRFHAALPPAVLSD
jgi:hypothetical protein